MQWTIRPMMDPRNEIDMRHLLVQAVAEEIWRRCGGNDVLNWMEAERHVEGFLEQAKPVEANPTLAANNESPFLPVIEVRHLRRPSPPLPAAPKRPRRSVAEYV